MRHNCWIRSWYLALASLLTVAVMARPGGAETLPYRAHVAQPTVELRSGPGDDYYATDTLPQGSEVEVYQERPDGWCAVRPPQGSYSWVFARHVRLLANGLGEVNKDDVASRVGSTAGDERNTVQVHLTKGEVVQILGADDRDGQTWYKIAPPSGEFRWVPKRSLASDGSLQTSAPSSDNAGATTTATNSQPPQSDVWRAAPQPAPQGVQLAAGETEGHAVTASREQSDRAAADAAAPVSASPWQPVSTQAAAADAAATPRISGNAVPDDFSRQVADLELRLSQMVAQPAVTWQIDQLDTEGEQLLSRAENVDQREAAKQALAKIDRFAAIFRRYQQSGGAGHLVSNTATSSQRPVSNVGGNQPPVGGQSRFDAVGVLRPVVSRRPGAPEYALVNDAGQVVSFVTPAPDLNLQPYLGRHIGIVGGRGYIPEFKRAHVTASRVTPLGDRLLR